MKFKSEKDLLVEALAAASRVTSRTPGPTFGLLLTLTGNQLTITGTDLETTVRVTLDVIGIDDGAVVIPARLLVDSTRLLDAGAVTVGLKSPDSDEVTVSLGRAAYSLRTYPLADYPKLPAVPAPTSTLPALDFVQGLSQVVSAASDDLSGRPLLTGVLFTQHEGTMRLVATDSYRLSIRDVPGVPPLSSNGDVLVPAKTLTEVLRAASSLSVDSEIAISLSDSEVTFLVGSVAIASRLIDGNFPDYRQLIPASYPNSLRVAKDTLSNSLRRARVVANEQNSSVKLTLREGGADVQSTAHDRGDVADNVDADFQGEELTIAFNPKFLMEGIDAVVGDEIILETTDASRPAMIHGVDDVTFRYLIMPVRVQ